MTLEMTATQSLSTITNQYLDQIPVFRMDTAMSHTAPDNAKRRVLRSLFQPLVLYLVDQSHAAGAEMKSPESVLNTVTSMPELQLDEKLVQQVSERYCQQTTNVPPRNWLQESLEISLADDEHPIKKLSQAVTGKLSDKARLELAKMGFTG